MIKMPVYCLLFLNFTSLFAKLINLLLLSPSRVIALMMEAEITSETSVNFYQTTRRNNPEDSRRILILAAVRT
jgi:hypothetical protein